MSERELHALIGDIYEAAIDRTAMPRVLRGLCTLTDSMGGVLCMHNGRTITHEIFDGIDPSWASKARELQHQNLFFHRRHLAPIGRAVLGETLAPLRDWQGLELFHDILQPAGCVHLLGLPLISKPDLFVEISLYRPKGRESHDTDELKIANILAQHLVRAFRVAGLVQDARNDAARLREALDRLAIGCLAIDAAGRLLFANAEAEAVLHRDRPLRLLRGRIVAANAEDRSAWQMLLHRLGGRDGPGVGTAISLGKTDGAPLHLLAVPLAPDRARLFGLGQPPSRRHALIVISEPDRGPAIALELLRQLFGLTPAEAMLAIALAGGERLRDYADRHERSLSTIKTHLRAVFAKTETSRQAELARLVAGLSSVRLEN